MRPGRCACGGHRSMNAPTVEVRAERKERRNVSQPVLCVCTIMCPSVPLLLRFRCCISHRALYQPPASFAPLLRRRPGGPQFCCERNYPQHMRGAHFNPPMYPYPNMHPSRETHSSVHHDCTLYTMTVKMHHERAGSRRPAAAAAVGRGQEGQDVGSAGCNRDHFITPLIAGRGALQALPLHGRPSAHALAAL